MSEKRRFVHAPRGKIAGIDGTRGENQKVAWVGRSEIRVYFFLAAVAFLAGALAVDLAVFPIEGKL